MMRVLAGKDQGFNLIRAEPSEKALWKRYRGKGDVNALTGRISSKINNGSNNRKRSGVEAEYRDLDFQV
jgi:hypothetical protein